MKSILVIFFVVLAIQFSNAQPVQFDPSLTMVSGMNGRPQPA